jgi:hypothetical protein
MRVSRCVWRVATGTLWTPYTEQPPNPMWRWVLQWVFRLLRAWARRNRDAIHRYFTERVLFISEENLRALSGGDDSVYRGLRVGYTIARLRVRLLIDDFIEGRVLPDTIVRR